MGEGEGGKKKMSSLHLATHGPPWGGIRSQGLGGGAANRGAKGSTPNLEASYYCYRCIDEESGSSGGQFSGLLHHSGESADAAGPKTEPRVNEV